MVLRKPLLLLLSILALPVASAAQSPPPMPPVPRLPEIGLPLPRIGLPPPSPPPETTRRTADGDRAGAGPVQRSRPIRRHGPATSAAPFVIFVPTSVPESPSTAAGAKSGDTSPAREPDHEARTGTLWLDVQPASPVQLFVDGYYIGTSDELGFALELEPGDRQVELRAPDFDPVQVKVRVVSGRAMHYPVALTASAARTKAPGPTGVPAAPTTIYVIAGCYVGNVPPAEVSLPPACDRRRVTTLVR